mgnify:CR=1 FL=1
MCNLYRMTKAASEVARWFGALDASAGANFGDEVYPGHPGLVVAGGEVRPMVWGFPLPMTGAKGQPLKPRPVNNARTDKLDSAFWRDSFANRRCLIPMTGWAEAEGERGARTRTWLTRPDAELFAAAGVWRMSREWGAVYSMVMTDSCGAAAECHARMPVLLAAPDWSRWTAGGAAEARALCVPYAGAIDLERTTQGWSKAAPPAEQPSLL